MQTLTKGWPDLFASCSCSRTHTLPPVCFPCVRPALHLFVPQLVTRQVKVELPPRWLVNAFCRTLDSIDCW